MASAQQLLNWRRDTDYEQRMKLLRAENEELDKKLRDFDALEVRLKYGKPSSPTLSSNPLPAESSSSKS